jgi:signal transduction histidine kinase
MRAPGRRLLSGARTRILAAFVVLLAASELVAVVAERQILLSRAGERVDDSLVQEVDEFRRLVRDGRNPLDGEPFGSDVEEIFDVFLLRNVPGEGEEIFAFLAGRPYRSTLGQARAVPRAVARLGRVPGVRRGEMDTAIGRVRYLAVPVAVSGRRRGTFVVTSNLANEQAEINDAIRVTAGVALAVLAIASILAYLVAGRVLAPVRELTETARAITETDLTRRIDVSGDDEIAELARTFNDMLGRLDAAFASQRALVSDAGHELRTPITIIRGHLELLGDDPDERRETVALVTDELDRMARFVEDLLTLAKAERSDFLRPEDLDLDVLTEELMAKASALAPRQWRLEGVGAGRLTADRQRLTQAMMSLAHNAVQHTEEGEPIGIGSELRGGVARLWVRDAGPGIAAADQSRIFQRFARADDRRRSEGAGLGLAIVRAIAESHGGRVTLDSRLGAGATFTVEIPTEPPPEVGRP